MTTAWMVGAMTTAWMVLGIANTESLLGVLGQFGATGVLAWYCWHVTKTTLPTIVREFREENEIVRESMQEEYRTIRAESKADRDRHDEQVHKLTEAIKVMAASCRTHNDATPPVEMGRGDKKRVTEDNGRVVG